MRTSDLLDGSFPRGREPEERVVWRYANILNDRCFKLILGAERNKEALIEILRVLIPERNITDIRYDLMKRKHNPYADGHDAMFDVECMDADGTRFVVEMQRWEQVHFFERVLFYSTFPVQAQVHRVKRKDRVPHDEQFVYPPVYVVSLMAFSMHADEQRLLYRYFLTEHESGEKMTDRLSFIFLEMDKVHEEPARDADVLTKLSWALMKMGTLKRRPAALVGKIFDKLFEACEIASYEQEEQKEILEVMTTERDKRNIAFTYWQKGMKETAAKLLALGVDIKKLTEATGLSEEAIKTSMPKGIQ